MDRALTGLGAFLAAGLLALLVLPLLALVVASSPTAVAAAVADPAFLPALGLSLATSASSVAVIVLAGTPLAWWLATSGSRWVRPVGLLVDLPLVVPPAALGIALLQAFGRRGLFGPALAAVGVQLPFTPAAVVVAQVVVAAPFYVQAAVNAFRDVDPEVLLVARTLGAGPAAAFGRVALPIALPGLVGAASLAWARALGELGATLLFAGSLPGRTTTLPLAVLTALESDVQLAVVLALALVALGGLLLGVLRAVPTWRP
ncbi:MAG: ABC transporter permease subunit [Alphaproteobacteria bacterium]|nr:ABC transporter permease subunit [Alphaproteobacteria bacterium]MCB9694417.1 ABC transporter permease subunit [Alphaproteobacteria bacterium]